MDMFSDFLAEQPSVHQAQPDKRTILRTTVT